MDIPQEELAAEQAAAQQFKEDEVRAKVITEFGFDEVDDKERIDKLVADKKDSHQKLTSAIGQKIKWRTEATKPKEEPTKPSTESKIAPEDIEKVVARTLEQRDLEGLDYPADIKKEIQRIAQNQGISVKTAARDPYIVFKIGEYEKEQKAEEAAISKTNRSGGKKTYSLDNPPQVDMATPEGRAQWKEYKEALTKAGN